MSGGCPRVFVTGAAAVSALGFEWRGLGRALLDGRPAAAASARLAQTHPEVPACEVPPVPAAVEVADGRAARLMARGAHLAAIAVARALRDAGWEAGREEIGLFFGVGASGGSMAELVEMLRASVVAGRFAVDRFGTEGLAACNPLFAFQLMNNFTLCHGAILTGVAGPNGAFFSRGGGTVAALLEAAHAVGEGDCARALAGGADSALHPVTWAELARAGHARGGLVPAEGAAALALAAAPEGALAVLEICALAAAGPPAEELGRTLCAGIAGAIDLVIVAAWGPPARAALAAPARDAFPGARVLALDACLGDALAATPALAWAAALDLLRDGHGQRALVLSAGIDGAAGAVVLGRPAP